MRQSGGGGVFQGVENTQMNYMMSKNYTGRIALTENSLLLLALR